MENKYRSHYCGNLTEKDIDKTVRVAGFVTNIRDHGGVIFVDVRDETGVVQIVSNDDKMFLSLTKESSVTLKGKIRKRDEETYNPKLATGTIEILVDEFTVLGKANNELPFEIQTSTSVNEELRLKYRYLDMRNNKVHNNIKFRSEVLKFIRNKMDDYSK